jgi:hypothetical protein
MVHRKMHMLLHDFLEKVFEGKKPVIKISETERLVLRDPEMEKANWGGKDEKNT